ncbi:MAG: hypothetical protein R3C99_06850 [Pirellulaceae bacterium]
MSKSKEPFNPFYAVLIVVGTVFAITACAYGMMAVVKLEPAADGGSPTGGLIGFMDRHGVTVLMVELGLLAVATFAAIGTDDYWTRRAQRREAERASLAPDKSTASSDDRSANGTDGERADT